MSSCGLLIIINKMLTLDIIDQSNLWTKKLNQLVKSLLTSEDSLMETKMQRLA